MLRLIDKCKTFKGGPLTRAHPNLCGLLEEVDAILQDSLQNNTARADSFDDGVSMTLTLGSL